MLKYVMDHVGPCKLSFRFSTSCIVTHGIDSCINRPHSPCADWPLSDDLPRPGRVASGATFFIREGDGPITMLAAGTISSPHDATQESGVILANQRLCGWKKSQPCLRQKGQK